MQNGGRCSYISKSIILLTIHGWHLVQRKNNETDKLFIDLNQYHENIKLMLEINPKLICTDQGITMQVCNKKQLPVH